MRRIIPAFAGSTLAELQRWSTVWSIYFSLPSRGGSRRGKQRVYRVGGDGLASVVEVEAAMWWLPGRGVGEGLGAKCADGGQGGDQWRGAGQGVGEGGDRGGVEADRRPRHGGELLDRDVVVQDVGERQVDAVGAGRDFAQPPQHRGFAGEGVSGDGQLQPPGGEAAVGRACGEGVQQDVVVDGAARQAEQDRRRGDRAGGPAGGRAGRRW